MSPGTISPPARLSPDFEVESFDSGELVLDQWLRRRALQNEVAGASRTYVVRAGRKVVGYYSLAVGAVPHVDSPGRLKRNMPDPVPMMVLGRLAVDKSFQGKGIGADLLRDGVLRITQAGEYAGIRGILVHAISERAKKFYEGFGFAPSPVDPMTVMITLSEALKILGGRI
jgi:GNAT superfamily N-acetyltransferase